MAVCPYVKRGTQAWLSFLWLFDHMTGDAEETCIPKCFQTIAAVCPAMWSEGWHQTSMHSVKQQCGSVGLPALACLWSCITQRKLKILIKANLYPKNVLLPSQWAFYHVFFILNSGFWFFFIFLWEKEYAQPVCSPSDCISWAGSPPLTFKHFLLH